MFLLHGAPHRSEERQRVGLEYVRHEVGEDGRSRVLFVGGVEAGVRLRLKVLKLATEVLEGGLCLRAPHDALGDGVDGGDEAGVDEENGETADHKKAAPLWHVALHNARRGRQRFLLGNVSAANERERVAAGHLFGAVAADKVFKHVHRREEAGRVANRCVEERVFCGRYAAENHSLAEHLLLDAVADNVRHAAVVALDDAGVDGLAGSNVVSDFVHIVIVVNVVVDAVLRLEGLDAGDHLASVEVHCVDAILAVGDDDVGALAHAAVGGDNLGSLAAVDVLHAVGGVACNVAAVLLLLVGTNHLAQIPHIIIVKHNALVLILRRLGHL